MTDDEFAERHLRDALSAAAEEAAPSDFRARLRAELEAELERAGSGAGERTGPSVAAGDSARDPSPDGDAHRRNDDGRDDGDGAVVLALRSRTEPDARPTTTQRGLRLAWVAAALLLVGAAVAGAWWLDDDDAVDSTSVAATTEPIDPVEVAERACARFVESTSFDDLTLEVLVSNGRQQWIDLGIDPADQLARVTEAARRLRDALRDAGFTGDDADTIERAVDALDQLATLTTAAAAADDDEAALDVVSRLRDPLVIAERELATLGVAGCT